MMLKNSSSSSSSNIVQSSIVEHYRLIIRVARGFGPFQFGPFPVWPFDSGPLNFLIISSRIMLDRLSRMERNKNFLGAKHAYHFEILVVGTKV